MLDSVSVTEHISALPISTAIYCVMYALKNHIYLPRYFLFNKFGGNTFLNIFRWKNMQLIAQEEGKGDHSKILDLILEAKMEVVFSKSVYFCSDRDISIVLHGVNF